MQYREDIEGLRAIAVVLIVFFHVRLTNVPGGFIGVDVFFVISGFLITNIVIRDITQDQFSFKDFYARRLRRLGPALLATIAMTLVAGWFILPPTLYQSTAQAAIAAVFSISNIYFWQQTGYFDVATAYKPLLHTWSLAVEEQFYLIWPVSLLIGARVLSRTGLLNAVFVVSLISLAASEWMLQQQASAAFFLTPFRIFAFGAGAVLALTGWQARNIISANIASLAGLLVIFYLAGNLHETDSFPGLRGLLPVLGTFLMIYAGPVAVMNRAISLAPLRYIGKISYSVYLVHWPIIVYYIFVVGPAQTSKDVLGLIGLALIAGALMYHLVELPFRRKHAEKFWVGYRSLSWGSLATVIIIVGVSWQVHSQRGYPSRYAPEIGRLFAALDVAIDDRAIGTRDFDCNATQNAAEVYFEAFTDCLPDEKEAMVVVLGDSHAADIYMGLQATYPNHNIVQLTGNGCNFAQPIEEKVFCAPYIEHWKNWIGQNTREVTAIIYSQSGGSLMSKGAGGIERPDPLQIKRLAEILEQIQLTSAPVLFWGPRPRLQPTIDIAIAASTDLNMLRNYYVEADFGADLGLDQTLSEFFADGPIQYISSASALCADTCMTLTHEDELFVVDYGHWTLAGAKQAVQQVTEASPALQNILTQ